MTASADSTDVARDIVAGLVEAGVREIVLAPGSRNAPLSFAAHDAERAGLLRLHVRVDERSAGFLALGLTKTGSRAAVVTTSGTAVANLHPALLEAAHAGVPMVAVSADRPARLRGTSANQTTDQVGIFGPLIPTTDLATVGELDVDAIWSATGPTHLNAQFDEPLMPADRWTPTVTVRPARQLPEPRIYESIERGPRTVVVAGDDAGPPARQLAEAGAWPLLAEPSSGARTGDHAIRTYRLILGEQLGEEVERVVVFGHPTLSRPITRLLSRDDVEIVAGPASGAWRERPFRVDRSFRTTLHLGLGEDPGPSAAEKEWLERWRESDRELGRGIDRLLAAQTGLTPYAVAAAVARALPPKIGRAHV
jgi:2-succinyl-5-enolpyruvyl-6-hydroxy-3-cyclohexene-1-carboxylate synthase